MKKFKIISIIGRPGCGKGTQIGILKKRNGFSVINTGEMLRKRAEKEDFIGGKIKASLKRGGLIPTPLVFYLWMPRLIEFHKKQVKGVLFDGNPRKLYEAHMLDEVMDMFGWQNNFCACYIKVSEKEAQLRLGKRGRSDDNKEEIKERLRWFKKEVNPVINYYKKKGVLLEINGEQSVEEVDRELREKINDFFNKK